MRLGFRLDQIDIGTRSLSKALLIDLDDTLFEERHYVESGFQTVAQYLADQHGVGAEQIFAEMLQQLDRSGRGAIFDDVLAAFELPSGSGNVAELVALYREHKPKIDLYDNVAETLADLAQQYKLALVTNGLGKMQRRKVEALEITPYFDAIVYCDEIGKPKPAPEGLLLALRELDITPSNAIMIGDNPLTDGLAAVSAGMPFVRITSQRFANRAGQSALELKEFCAVTEFLGGML